VDRAKDILKQMNLIEADAAIEAGDVKEADTVKLKLRALRNCELIELVRSNRDNKTQDIGFNTRPFVLCGLPLRKPEGLDYVRTNGDFLFRITGDPKFGLPFGQDRLIPIWVASLAMRQQSRTIHFKSAGECLMELGLSLDGRTYRRLVEGFKRIFGTTMFFGTKEQGRSDITNWGRYHFFDKMQLWFTGSLDQTNLPLDEFENIIVLSESFWQELRNHPIPVDLHAVRALRASPGALDFYMWLTWRCWRANNVSHIPLHGKCGLASQFGVAVYSRQRRFTQQIVKWIRICKQLWPECPATLSPNRRFLVINKASAIWPSRVKRMSASTATEQIVGPAAAHPTSHTDAVMQLVERSATDDLIERVTPDIVAGLIKAGVNSADAKNVASYSLEVTIELVKLVQPKSLLQNIRTFEVGLCCSPPESSLSQPVTALFQPVIADTSACEEWVLGRILSSPFQIARFVSQNINFGLTIWKTGANIEDLRQEGPGRNLGS
jgi:hypothetical protein